MRTIKFRGVDAFDPDRTFHYGDLRLVESGTETCPYICRNGSMQPVKEATVGQFTGICDKLGTPIYEGDILDLNGYDSGFVSIEHGHVMVRVSETDIKFPLTVFNRYEIKGNLHFGKDNEKKGGIR